MQKSLLTLILTLLVTVAVSAPSEAIHEFNLANGLQLLVVPDDRAPVVSTQVWYHVGSSYEPAGLTGVSHLLEHMMFQGTKTYPAGEYQRIISNNGGTNNAMTSDDFTAYYSELAKDKLSLALSLEADRMRHLAFTDEDFAKEKQVVMEERRMRTDNNPIAKTYEYFNALAFITNPYRQPTVGWMDDIKNTTKEDAYDWYQKWYSPNNATIVVVGDVEPEQVHKLVQKHFASFKPSTLPSQKPIAKVTTSGERHIQVHLEAKVPWQILGFPVPSIKTADVAWEPYALDVLAYILAGNESARLTKEIVRNQKVASSLAIDYSPATRLPTLFTIAGTINPSHTAEELKTRILKEIDNIKSNGVTTAELDRVKAMVIAQKIYGQDSMFNRGMQLGIGASTKIPWQVLDAYPQHIEAVTPEQVQAVAKKYLVVEHLTQADLIPQSTERPQSGEAS